MDSVEPEQTCSYCKRGLDDEDTLRCSFCSHPQHFGCVGVTTDDFKNALKDGLALWKCSHCQDSLEKSKAEPSESKSLEVAIVEGVARTIDARLKKLERFQASQMRMHELLYAQLKAIQSELSYLAVSKQEEEEEEPAAPVEKAQSPGIPQKLMYAMSFIIPVIQKMQECSKGRKILKMLPKYIMKLVSRIRGGKSLPAIDSK